MHPIKDPWDNLNIDVVKKAATDAMKHKSSKTAVIKFKKSFDENCQKILEKLENDEYVRPEYMHKKKYNYNKVRYLSYTDFEHNIIMHVLVLLGEPKWKKSRVDVAYNCVKGYGINSKIKHQSFNHMMKHARYDLKSEGWMQLDISKCYPSTNGKVLAKKIHEIYGYGRYSIMLINYSITEFGIPIGTPLSPFIHHIMMMDFDHFVKEELRPDAYLRYADDCYLQGTIADLHTWSWRIRFYLYYKCGYLVKRNLKIRPMKVAPDIGGYVYHQSEMNSGHHNKGFTRIRKHTVVRAKRKPSEPAYYGIMMHADALNLMVKRMDFSKLVDKMLLHREYDSPEIDIDDLAKIKNFSIEHYEVRPPKVKDGKTKSGWMKMQISYKDKDHEKRQLRCVKGSFSGIITSLLMLEDYVAETMVSKGWSRDMIDKKLFPITNVSVEYDGGWIFSGTAVKQLESE